MKKLSQGSTNPRHQVTIATKNCVLASGLLSAYSLLAPGVSIAFQSTGVTKRLAATHTNSPIKSLLLSTLLAVSLRSFFSFSLTSKTRLCIPGAGWMGRRILAWDWPQRLSVRQGIMWLGYLRLSLPPLLVCQTVAGPDTSRSISELCLWLTSIIISGGGGGCVFSGLGCGAV